LLAAAFRPALMSVIIDGPSYHRRSANSFFYTKRTVVPASIMPASDQDANDNDP